MRRILLELTTLVCWPPKIHITAYHKNRPWTQGGQKAQDGWMVDDPARSQSSSSHHTSGLNMQRITHHHISHKHMGKIKQFSCCAPRQAWQCHQVNSTLCVSSKKRPSVGHTENTLDTGAQRKSLHFERSFYLFIPFQISTRLKNKYCAVNSGRLRVSYHGQQLYWWTLFSR